MSHRTWSSATQKSAAPDDIVTYAKRLSPFLSDPQARATGKARHGDGSHLFKLIGQALCRFRDERFEDVLTRELHQVRAIEDRHRTLLRHLQTNRDTCGTTQRSKLTRTNVTPRVDWERMLIGCSLNWRALNLAKWKTIYS